MKLDAQARIKGCYDNVILLGVEGSKGLVLYSDGSMDWRPLDDIRMTLLEAQARFVELEKSNLNIVVEAREHME